MPKNIWYTQQFALYFISLFFPDFPLETVDSLDKYHTSNAKANSCKYSTEFLSNPTLFPWRIV